MTTATVFRNGTVLTMDASRSVLHDADVLVVGEQIAAVGRGLEVPEGTVEIDARARHRDAGDGRHAPPHVADRDARLRRGLDADPVLRLVLPASTARRSGPRTSTPATCSAPSRPSTPASPPPSTGRTACRPSTTPTRRWTRWSRCRAGSSSPTATSRPAPWEWSAVARVPRLRQPPHHAGQRHARVPDGVRRHRRPGVPGAPGLRGRARAGRSRSPPTPACGARPTTTASA